MYEKFVISALCVILSLVIGICGLVYVVDPFNHYRADKDMTKIIYQLPNYQNTGIAKHTEYDTLITGSSMVMNFRAWWFDEVFGCKAIRLGYSGGIVGDYSTLLNIAIQNNDAIKTIYYGLDNYTITGDSKRMREAPKTPKYLIDNNPLNDIKYLLNKDVLLTYTRTCIYYGFKRDADYDFHEMHAWDRVKRFVFSKEQVISDYTYTKSDVVYDEQYFMDYAEDFCNAIIPFAKDNPQIHFVFFAPPYSVLYWHGIMCGGVLDATVCALKHVYAELLKHSNVNIYYFQNEYEKISDLDKYRDKSHYCTEYNKYMLSAFQSGDNLLTTDNYESVLDDMAAYVKQYDFDSLLDF